MGLLYDKTYGRHDGIKLYLTGSALEAGIDFIFKTTIKN